MKKYSKILKLSLILFGVGLAIVLITFAITGELYSFSINSRGFNIHSSNFSNANNPAYYTTNNVALEQFDSVNIVSMSEEIRFIPSNEFRIEYSIDDRFTVEKCYVKNGTLEFYFSTPNNSFGVVPNYSSGYINIYYDQSINNGEFDEFEIVMAFSSIDFAGVNKVNKLEMSSASQDLYIDFEFNQAEINIAAGNIDIINLGDDVKKIEVILASGDINLTLKDNDVDIEFTTMTGKGYQNGVEFKGRYKGLNGKTNIEVTSFTGDLNFYY